MSAAERARQHNLVVLVQSAKEKIASGKRLTKAELDAIETVEGTTEEKKSESYYAKQTDIANAHGVNVRTVARWVTLPEFPAKEKNGYPKAEVDEFVRANSLGKGPAAHKSGEVTLTEARIKHTLESAENERIKKERQLVEQAKDLGQLLDANDVRSDVGQLVATFIACADALHTAIDRELPESFDGKERVLALAAKFPKDIAAAVADLW